MSAARLLVVLLLLGAGVAVAVPARADDAGLTVTLAPAEIAVQPGSTATGLLVLANPGAAPETATVSDVAGTAAVTVHYEDPPTTEVPSHSEVVVKYTVTRSQASTGATGVQFVVTTSAGTADPVVGSLSLPATEAGPLVDASFEGKLDAVDENRPGETYLLISNPRAENLSLESLTVAAPQDVAVRVTCSDGAQHTFGADSTQPLSGCLPGRLGPHDRVALRVHLEPSDAVATGPRTLVAWVTAAAPDGTQTATPVTSTDFDVDVFGESALLQAVGVPAFFLLPGVLILLCSGFLVTRATPWRRLYGSAHIATLQGGVTLAVLGVALSLLMAKVYPWLTDPQHWPGSLVGPDARRDYLRAQGFTDFYWVYVYAFLISVVIWGLAALASLALPLWRRLFVLGVGDQAPDALRKVAFRSVFAGHGDAERERVTTGVGEAAKGALLVRRTSSTEFLATSRVLVTPAQADEREELQKLLDQRRYLKLWRRARKGRKEGTVDESYDTPKDIGPPRILAEEDVHHAGQRAPLVSIGDH